MRGMVVEVNGLSKTFGRVTAVSGLSFTAQPGEVTGFLGPNGAGKTTTLRMLLGLVAPTAGTATIGGLDYRALDSPLERVGAALEASSFHPGRTAAAHLRIQAAAGDIRSSRVDRVLELVGLAEHGSRRVGGYSLGMRQRLGLASALLGDPDVLILDEPANGLDPEGIRWMREALRAFAAEGRTVLVSSHLLGEVQQTVDRAVVIARGRCVFAGALGELAGPDAVLADTPDRATLEAAVLAAGGSVESTADGLRVSGLSAERVGAAALSAGVALSHLSTERASLESAFLDLVSDREPEWE